MAKVLIVEDDGALSNAYSVVLTKAGFDTTPVFDGQQALDAVADNHYDAIVLDMLMPDVSGLEFLKQAKLKTTSPHTKVLVISNTESPKIREEAMQHGAVDYLLKVECTPHDIAERVAALLK